ncbi:hypothetical protein Tco_1504400 [Tanacetum coccineum]
MPYLKRTYSQDLDLLEQHLTKDILSRTVCTTTLTDLITKFENSFHSEFKERMRKYTRYNAQSFNDAMIYIRRSFISNPSSELDSLKVDLVVKQNSCSEKETTLYFVEYTGIEVQHFRDTLLQHLGNVKKSVAERTCHQRQYERRVNKRQMQTQESKIDIGKALDADLVDTESIRTNSTVQDDSNRSGNDTDTDDADIRPIYDEEPMAEVQLTAECNIFAIRQQHTEQPKIIVEGRGDQYPETCQVKSPMLDSSPDNQTTEYSKQSLESENILLKRDSLPNIQKIFSRIKHHCIALELKYQNQALKSGQHGQILNETSNKAKIEKEIDEKVFAIAALKNDLRKLKGNSVDTKFDKTSVLGKPVLPSLRNQSVVRQPNAFKSERAQMSKQRFASQVDVNKNLSKPNHQLNLPKKIESTFAKPDHIDCN